jgi:uncharacterized protein (DUF2236 family)
MESVRALMAEALRSRVNGPTAEARAREILEAPGDRWFDQGRPIRRVHSDAAMFAGGLRALLLQSLHPLAMAGVSDHSDYRRDPWGRLQRTADFLAATTYGPVEQAQAAVDRVKAVHRHVVGTAADGRPYSAGDPHLMLWVHLCEVDSFLAAVQRYGNRLSAVEADGYVEDMAFVARKLDVPHAPTNVAELRAAIASFRPELAPTPAAREAARFLLFPPMPTYARAPYGVLAAASVALLPWWARWQLRLPVLPVTEEVLVKPAGSAITGLLRWAMTSPS